MDSSGRVLPIRTGSGLALGLVPPSCVVVSSKSTDGAVSVVTSEFQKFSPFTVSVLQDDTEQTCQVGEAMGGSIESRSFLPHHIRSASGATVTSGHLRSGTNGGALDYDSYYVPGAEYYCSLPKEQSLESQDSSTLSSPPSDSLTQPGAKGPAGAPAPDSLFQFSIGKILEDEAGTVDQQTTRGLPGLYDGVMYSEGSGANMEAPSPPQIQPANRPEADPPSADQRQIRR